MKKLVIGILLLFSTYTFIYSQNDDGRISDEIRDSGDSWDGQEIAGKITENMKYDAFVEDMNGYLFKNNEKHIIGNNINIFTRIIGIMVLLLCLYRDLIKNLISERKELEQSNEKEDRDPIALGLKYTLLIVVVIFPKIYSSGIIFINVAIEEPIKYSYEKSEGIVKQENIDIIKVFNYYATLNMNSKYKFNDFLNVQNFALKTAIKMSEGSSFLSKIGIYAYYGGLRIIYQIQRIAEMVLIVISKIMIYLLALFFPLVVALNYLPGFKGNILPIIKYVVSFSLWGVIAKAINELTRNLNIAQTQAKIHGIITSLEGENFYSKSQEVIDIIYENMNIGNYVTAIIITSILLITPKIADMLISGSQSGAFFSVVNTYTTSVAKGLETLRGGGSVGKGTLLGMTGKEVKAGDGALTTIGKNIGKTAKKIFSQKSKVDPNE